MDRQSATTDRNGQAQVNVSSVVAGTCKVTVTVGDGSKTTDTTFVADFTTASLTNPGAGLVTVIDNAVANGQATNRVKATVTDAQGNPAPGVVIDFTAGNGATILAQRMTGADGTVSVTLTSLHAGLSTVTADIAKTSKSVGSTASTDTHFTQDVVTVSLTGRGAGLVTVVDNMPANGVAQDSVKATVTDAGGNPVAGVTVGFSADRHNGSGRHGDSDADQPEGRPGAGHGVPDEVG